MKKLIPALLTAVCLALLSGCAPAKDAPPAPPQHWAIAPAPSVWPLGSVHGRIGRGSAGWHDYQVKLSRQVLDPDHRSRMGNRQHSTVGASSEPEADAFRSLGYVAVLDATVGGYS